MKFIPEPGQKVRVIGKVRIMETKETVKGPMTKLRDTPSLRNRILQVTGIDDHHDGGKIIHLTDMVRATNVVIGAKEYADTGASNYLALLLF